VLLPVQQVVSPPDRSVPWPADFWGPRPWATPPVPLIATGSGIGRYDCSSIKLIVLPWAPPPPPPHERDRGEEPESQFGDHAPPECGASRACSNANLRHEPGGIVQPDPGNHSRHDRHDRSSAIGKPWENWPDTAGNSRRRSVKLTSHPTTSGHHPLASKAVGTTAIVLIVL